MFRLYLFYLVLLGVCIFSETANSQISQGGIPLEFNKLKSSGKSFVEMPAFTNAMLSRETMQNQSNENRLKPFRFAHPFEVNLTPENSGEWGVADNGYSCWRLTIRSKGAKSINLIFEDFKLPKQARLYIYNENKILGAFTDYNNKTTEKFAVAPLEGDEITVQFEVPEKNKNENNFRITRVNHDFVGILKSNDRRPLGITAGSCNVDINCDVADKWSDVKNSVCRMIVHGYEVCTGTLVNNTSEDQKPYILSAAHCYDKWEYAETTIYVFNYESPFCAPLDGDPSNSVSGAIMKAQFDSLDFALTELSLVPPPEYRPYYAGWDHSSSLPDSTASIHHPQGDIKKIAFDYDPPDISDFNANYKKNGFLKITKWDAGVTEAGSSGGPLFNTNKEIIGTLTGGVADCADPVRDYFERLALSWDYKSDSSKQLKYWLDPLKTGSNYLNGNQYNTDENLCGSFTNMTDNDSYETVSIENSGIFSGYWGGSNNVGITEFMERFSIPGNEQLSGISLGVGKIKTSGINNQSEITIKVYDGGKLPESILHTEKVKIKNLVANAMNFIGFSEIVEPQDTFFVGYEISNVQSADTFVVFQSLRKSFETNSFFLKQNNNWLRFNDANASGKSMANVFEIVACNIDNISTDTPLVNNPLEILLYPNPTKQSFVLESGQDIPENSVSVYNLIGQEVEVKMDKIQSRKMEVDMSGNIPGIYIVRLTLDNKNITRKLSFVPW